MPIKDIYKQDAMIDQLMKRYPAEIITSTMSQKDYSIIMKQHIKIWMTHSFSSGPPVKNVGLLVDLLEGKSIHEWEQEDFEFWLSESLGILGWDGKEKLSPKVCLLLHKHY